MATSSAMKRRAVAGAKLADAADEFVRRDDGAEVADDRLHDESGNIALLQQRLDLAKGLVVQWRLNLMAVRQEVFEMFRGWSDAPMLMVAMELPW